MPPDESRPKILPPSMRPQKRYIVFEVVADGPVPYQDVMAAIWDALLSFAGEAGAAATAAWFLHNLYANGRGVLRCNHDTVEQMRVALALVHVVGETPAIVRIVGVTGTIKSAKMKYLGQADAHEPASLTSTP